MSERPEWLDSWFEQIVGLSDQRVTEITLEASERWSLRDGAIRHRSGRFFSVVGTIWTTPWGTRESQPMLKQGGAGTLGVLMSRNGKSNRLLAYAKVEPGNVGTVQLAPTCQATASNLDRVHGGTLPPFADVFNRRDTRYAYDQLQSEQGSRFLGKANRNVLAVSGDPPELPPTHRWLPVEEVLELSDASFVLNSDARSVLICSPWKTLVGREPFSRYRDGFGAELARSAQAAGPGEWHEALRDDFGQRRRSAMEPVEVDLYDLAGWSITESGIEPESSGPFRVFQIKVEVRGREVSSWDQPIIDSAGGGQVDLVCGRIDGVLHFLMRSFTEAGLHNLAQLGPTSLVEPGELSSATSTDCDKAVVRAECLNSEEGSRFFKDVIRFRVIDVGDAFDPPDGCYWLTLGSIRGLLDESGWLMEEARSALSLLLKWL